MKERRKFYRNFFSSKKIDCIEVIEFKKKRKIISTGLTLVLPSIN